MSEALKTNVARHVSRIRRQRTLKDTLQAYHAFLNLLHQDRYIHAVEAYTALLCDLWTEIEAKYRV
jgi:acid stress-induced BolA-like protein IbaG/YrbA